MRVSRALNCVFPALIFFALVFFPGGGYAADPHNFSSFGCESCHKDDGRNGKQSDKIFSEDIDALCVKCHDSCSPGKKHQGSQGLSSAKSENSTLPFDKTGKIACYTCHDPHMDFVDRKTKMKTSYLRISNLKRELCLSCHTVGGGKIDGLKVIYPPEKVIVQGNYMPIMGTAKDLSDSHLSLSINGSSFMLRVREGVFYTRLRMDEGLNIVELSDDGGVLWRGEVYSAGDLRQPADYQMVYYNHQVDSREECLGCHLDERGMPLVSENSSAICHRCHQPMNTKKFLHGPLGAGECLPCHGPHGGSGNYYLKSEGPSLCLECHITEEVSGHDEASVDSQSYCLDCHDPHQSDTWYLGKETRVKIKSELIPIGER